MELKGFIEQSLVSITEAMVDANAAISPRDGLVNPRNTVAGAADKAGYGTISAGEPHRLVEAVTFDIAVYADDTKGGSGGISIQVASIGVSAGGKKEVSSGSTSRIQFTVPIAYPQG